MTGQQRLILQQVTALLHFQKDWARFRVADMLHTLQTMGIARSKARNAMQAMLQENNGTVAAERTSERMVLMYHTKREAKRMHLLLPNGWITGFQIHRTFLHEIHDQNRKDKEDNTMTDQRFRVITDLTQAEYEEQQRLAQNDPDRHMPLLESASEHGGKFTEEHIPDIVMDTLIESLDPDTKEEGKLLRIDPNDWDTSGWPFGLKCAVMELAVKHWLPLAGDSTTCWIGDQQTAQQFFRRLPALRRMFERPQEDTAHAWLLSNPRQSN